MKSNRSNRSFPILNSRLRPPLVRYFPPVLPTMSPHKSRYRWCLVEGDPQPYDVFDIPIGSNVARLKAMIKKRIECLHDTCADRLKLLKLNMMVPIDPDHSLAQRLADLGNVDAYLTELSSGEKVGVLFPKPPSGDHLHIVVQRPGVAPSASWKRKEVGGNARDAQTRCAAIRTAIQAMPDNLDLSDPSTFKDLPCPSPLLMPPECFEVKEIDGVECFEYMGRSQFHELQERIKDKNFQKGAESIYLYGTSGSGKSHLLAALVYHLVREGQRVFYIPDCSSLLLDPAKTMWDAYHFAYNCSPDLRTTESVETLIDSMRTDPDVYIIVDQVNALESTKTDSRRETKNRVLGWLGNLRSSHRYIFSASANEASNRDAEKRQNGISVFSIFGGMSQDETNQWFKWHGHRIPSLSDKQRQHVEYLTGRIPLLLCCLFKITDFSEPEFRNTPVLHNVKSDVDEFARTNLMLLKGLNKEKYLEIMTACVRGDRVESDDQKLYDLRHFYVDTKRIGRFTCGVAFEAMVSILRTHDNTLFVDGLWYAVVSGSDNPVVQGFLAEQICLGHIAAKGLTVVNPKLKQMSTASFKTQPNFDHHLSSDHDVCLYIPDDYNFMAVDGVILLLNHTSKKATVFSIQFTLSQNHKQSDKDFHEKLWSTWTEPIASAGFKVRSTFVWIDKEQPSEHVEDKVVKKRLRSGRKFSVIHVGLKAVHPRLAYALGIEQ